MGQTGGDHGGAGVRKISLCQGPDFWESYLRNRIFLKANGVDMDSACEVDEQEEDTDMSVVVQHTSGLVKSALRDSAGGRQRERQLAGRPAYRVWFKLPVEEHSEVQREEQSKERGEK